MATWVILNPPSGDMREGYVGLSERASSRTCENRQFGSATTAADFRATVDSYDVHVRAFTIDIRQLCRTTFP